MHDKNLRVSCAYYVFYGWLINLVLDERLHFLMAGKFTHEHYCDLNDVSMINPYLSQPRSRPLHSAHRLWADWFMGWYSAELYRYFERVSGIYVFLPFVDTQENVKSRTQYDRLGIFTLDPVESESPYVCSYFTEESLDPFSLAYVNARADPW